MQSSDRVQEYLKTVCGQIRWKKAHAVVAEELANHLADQRDAYITDGTDEATATEAAIAQMGDPVAVGTQLDRTHRPRPQWSMLALAAILICSGALIQLFFELRLGGYIDPDTIPQIISYPISLVIMAAVYLLDFSIIGRRPLWFFILPMAWLSVNFVLSLTIPRSSELFYVGIVPLLMPLGFAGFIYAMRNKGGWGLAACGMALLLPSAMMLNLWSRSDSLLFAVSSLVILCVAAAKGWFGISRRRALLLVLVPLATALLAAVIFVMLRGYSWEQIMAALGPSYGGDISADVRTLLSHSRLVGPGIIPDVSLSLEPWDGYNVFYILTYLIFDIGWLPVMLLLTLVLFFFVMGFVRCFQQKSILGLLVSLVVMMTLTLQTYNYVLANLGFRLYLSFSMPLILGFSFDNYTNMALIGLMLSVFRTGDAVSDRLVKKQRFMPAA
jgi:hypothetical protein